MSLAIGGYVTTKAVTAGITVSATCFSGDMMVKTEIGYIPITELSQGQPLNQHDEILDLHHYRPSVIALFYRIETENDKFIEITGEHMIYTKEHDWIPACRLKSGYHLQDENGKDDEIVNISEITKKGIYNPVSSSGELIVNGIKVSCYTNLGNDKLTHQKAHTLFQKYIKITGWREILEFFKNDSSKANKNPDEKAEIKELGNAAALGETEVRCLPELQNYENIPSC